MNDQRHTFSILPLQPPGRRGHASGFWYWTLTEEFRYYSNSVTQSYNYGVRRLAKWDRVLVLGTISSRNRKLFAVKALWPRCTMIAGCLSFLPSMYSLLMLTSIMFRIRCNKRQSSFRSSVFLAISPLQHSAFPSGYRRGKRSAVKLRFATMRLKFYKWIATHIPSLWLRGIDFMPVEYFYTSC